MRVRMESRSLDQTVVNVKVFQVSRSLFFLEDNKVALSFVWHEFPSLNIDGCFKALHYTMSGRANNSVIIGFEADSCTGWNPNNRCYHQQVPGPLGRSPVKPPCSVSRDSETPKA